MVDLVTRQMGENESLRPGRSLLIILLRSIASFVAGLLVMGVGVSVYQGLLLTLPMYLRDPEAFELLMELSSRPDELVVAYEDGRIPTPGTLMLAITLVLDAVCAAAGGFIVAWIAARAKMTHAVVFAVLMCGIGVMYAAISQIEAVLPVWVPWLRALLATPIGIMAGAWLRLRSRSKA